MSEIALSAALAPSLKPRDSGVSEPADPDAFAAIAASLGFASVQTSARQQASPAASLGRIEGAPGNVMPLRALNVVAARAVLLVQQPGADVVPALQRDGAAHAPFNADRLTAGRFAATAQTSATGLPAGRLPAFDPSLRPQAADAFPVPLTAAADDPSDSPLSLALSQISALAGEPVVATGGAIASNVAPSGAVVTAEAPVPLHHPRFVEAFSQQVTVMARDGVQHARITVNPPELGPVELRIVLRNDEATVHFAAQHAAVRDVLEDAMPRLREQFEQAGLRLHDGAVFEQLPQRSTGQGFEHADAGDQLPFDEPDDEGGVQRAGPFARHGLIDAYA